MLPVPPYGLERVRTAAEAAGAEVRLLDPYLIVRRPARRRRPARGGVASPTSSGFGLRVLEDCIPIDDLRRGRRRTTCTTCSAEVRGLVDALREAAPHASLVLGGAGFSACPGACLEALDVPHGIVGAGEAPFVSLLRAAGAGARARRRARARAARRSGRGRRLADARSAGRRCARRSTRRRTASPCGTRVGCAMACAYCTASVMDRRHANGDVRRRRGRGRALVEAGPARGGIDPVQVFFADDEFNLPGEEHAVAVLRGARRRRARRGHVEWRAYAQPRRRSPTASQSSPVATHGFVSVTADSAADAVLARSGKPFRRRHLDELLERTAAHGVRTELGLDLRAAGRERGDARRDDRLRAGPAARRRGRLRRRRPRAIPTRRSAASRSRSRSTSTARRACAWRSRPSTPPSASRARWPGGWSRRSPTCRTSRAWAWGTHARRRRSRTRTAPALAGDRDAWADGARPGLARAGAGGRPHAGRLPAHRPLARALRPRRQRGRPAAARGPAARRLRRRPAARAGGARRDGPCAGPAAAPGARRPAPDAGARGCGAASRAGRARCRAGCRAASRAGGPPPGRRRRRGC